MKSHMMLMALAMAAFAEKDKAWAARFDNREGSFSGALEAHKKAVAKRHKKKKVK